MSAFEQGLYVGEFRHNLDVKKRLTVPSRWRFPGDDQATFLAIPDPNGSVTVYPPKMVAKLQESLTNISIGDRKGQRALTRLLGSADSFAFDKSGRLHLNDRLYDHAALEKEVVLVGTLNKFNLWNPERYEAYIEADEDEGDLSDVLASLGL